MAVIHLKKDTFESEVMQYEGKVLVDFWASWCGPCKMIGPVIEELGNELTDIKVTKVNVDEEPELAGRYNVMSIPTLMIFENGKPAGTSVGVKSKNEILKMLGK